MELGIIFPAVIISFAVGECCDPDAVVVEVSRFLPPVLLEVLPPLWCKFFFFFRCCICFRWSVCLTANTVFCCFAGVGEGQDDKAEGLSAALLWVLDFVESEEFGGDTRPRYWAVRCLLDALVSRTS